MIWLALLIPVLAIGFLAWKFPKKMNILEYALLFLVPTICIFVGKWSSVSGQMKDAEYWNSYGTHAIYEEKWDEEVPCSHEKYRTEYYTDSDGNTHSEQVFDGYEHNYDVDYHPERWTLKDNIGSSMRINQQFFENLCKVWDMRLFKNMHRDFHSYDGDAYETRYDKKVENTITICTKHSYKNRIQCSKSVFNFREVTPETKSQYKLFEYPAVNKFNYNPILGHKDSAASKKLQIHNALNGSRRQLHMLLLVFKDQPLEAGLFQESYWVGGNKNEFIVCVGTKGDDIKWTKVISWTTNEELKVQAARQIKEMKTLDVNKVVDYMTENVPKKFIRREFEEFSYITVRPTTRAIMITYIITLLTTIIISVISIFNDSGFGTFIGSGRRSYGRYR